MCEKKCRLGIYSHIGTTELLFYIKTSKNAPSTLFINVIEYVCEK